MKRILKVLGVTLIMMFIVLFAVPVFAGFEVELDPDSDGGIIIPEPRPVTEEYGIEDLAYTWVHAHEFKIGLSAQANHYYWAGGYYGRLTEHEPPPIAWFRAPLKLPSGVDVKEVRLFFGDFDEDKNVRFVFYRSNTEDNSTDTVGAVESSGNVGYSTIGFDPNIIFDNYNQYYFAVRLNSNFALNHQFKGVRVAYRRTISPPPATQTFSDVSPTLQFFPYIEALASSGITTGYGDGTFRPNQFVTRGQMAAFLARALGLHHPDPLYE